MNIAIVENDAEDSSAIIHLLKEFEQQQDDIFHVACFKNAEEFLMSVQKGSYDLCFMDIFLDQSNGVEAAKKLRSIDSDCYVIFLTSSPDYLQEGYRVRAWRYLLKPLMKPLFYEALTSCIEEAALLNRCLHVIIDRKEHELPVAKIVYIMTENRNITIYTMNSTYSLSRRISFEGLTKSLLSDPRFLILGQGILVNLAFVHYLDGCDLLMTNNIRLPVSRRRRKEVSEQIIRYQLQA